MVIRQPERLKALTEIWNSIQIAEQQFQTEGDCNIEIDYTIFYNYEVFDASKSICKNLQNFASNARQFVENFVCLDNDALPNKTLKKISCHYGIRWLRNLKTFVVMAEYQP